MAIDVLQALRALDPSDSAAIAGFLTQVDADANPSSSSPPPSPSRALGSGGRSSITLGGGYTRISGTITPHIIAQLVRTSAVVTQADLDHIEKISDTLEAASNHTALLVLADVDTAIRHGRNLCMLRDTFTTLNQFPYYTREKEAIQQLIHKHETNETEDLSSELAIFNVSRVQGLTPLAAILQNQTFTETPASKALVRKLDTSLATTLASRRTPTSSNNTYDAELERLAALANQLMLKAQMEQKTCPEGVDIVAQLRLTINLHRARTAERSPLQKAAFKKAVRAQLKKANQHFNKSDDPLALKVLKVMAGVIANLAKGDMLEVSKTVTDFATTGQVRLFNHAGQRCLRRIEHEMDQERKWDPTPKAGAAPVAF